MEGETVPESGGGGGGARPAGGSSFRDSWHSN